MQLMLVDGVTVQAPPATAAAGNDRPGTGFDEVLAEGWILVTPDDGSVPYVVYADGTRQYLVTDYHREQAARSDGAPLLVTPADGDQYYLFANGSRVPAGLPQPPPEAAPELIVPDDGSRPYWLFPDGQTVLLFPDIPEGEPLPLGPYVPPPHPGSTIDPSDRRLYLGAYDSKVERLGELVAELEEAEEELERLRAEGASEEEIEAQLAVVVALREAIGEVAAEAVELAMALEADPDAKAAAGAEATAQLAAGLPGSAQAFVIAGGEQAIIVAITPPPRQVTNNCGVVQHEEPPPSEEPPPLIVQSEVGRVIEELVAAIEADSGPEATVTLVAGQLFLWVEQVEQSEAVALALEAQAEDVKEVYGENSPEHQAALARAEAAWARHEAAVVQALQYEAEFVTYQLDPDYAAAVWAAQAAVNEALFPLELHWTLSPAEGSLDEAREELEQIEELAGLANRIANERARAVHAFDLWIAGLPELAALGERVNPSYPSIAAPNDAPGPMFPSDALEREFALALAENNVHFAQATVHSTRADLLALELGEKFAVYILEESDVPAFSETAAGLAAALNHQVALAARDHTVAAVEVARLDLESLALEQRIVEARQQRSPHHYRLEGYTSVGGTVYEGLESIRFEERDGQLYQVNTYANGEVLEIRVTWTPGSVSNATEEMQQIYRDWEALYPRQVAAENALLSTEVAFWERRIQAWDLENGPVVDAMTQERSRLEAQREALIAEHGDGLVEAPLALPPVSFPPMLGLPSVRLPPATQWVEGELHPEIDAIDAAIAEIDAALGILAAERHQLAHDRDFARFTLAQPPALRADPGALAARFYETHPEHLGLDFDDYGKQELYREQQQVSAGAALDELVATVLGMGPGQKEVAETADRIRDRTGAASNEEITVDVVPFVYLDPDYGKLHLALFKVTDRTGRTWLVDESGYYRDEEDFRYNNKLSPNGIIHLPRNLEVTPDATGRVPYGPGVSARELTWAERTGDMALGGLAMAATVASVLPGVGMVARPIALGSGALLGLRSAQRLKDMHAHGRSVFSWEGAMEVTMLVTAGLPVLSSGARLGGLYRSSMTVTAATRSSTGAIGAATPYALEASRLMAQPGGWFATARWLDAGAITTGLPLVGYSVYELAAYRDEMSELEWTYAFVGLATGVFGTGMGAYGLHATWPGRTQQGAPVRRAEQAAFPYQTQARRQQTEQAWRRRLDGALANALSRDTAPALDFTVPKQRPMSGDRPLPYYAGIDLRWLLHWPFRRRSDGGDAASAQHHQGKAIGRAPVTARGRVPAHIVNERPPAPDHRLPESTASASLRAFLDQVVLRMEAIGTADNFYPVYHLYSDRRSPQQLTISPAEYLWRVSELAHDRPYGAVARSQARRDDKWWVYISRKGMEEKPEVGILGDISRAGNSFFIFDRKIAIPDPGDPPIIKERIYINARADHAPEVMTFVVREMVDNPRAFPGVVQAKIAGPMMIGRRSDGIVVYVKTQADQQRVVDALSAYQQDHPEHFTPEVPAMTEAVLPGVSLASEPPSGFSFGEVRSRAILAAVRDTLALRANTGPDFNAREVLGARVRERFRQYGIDPDNPARNLPLDPLGSPGSLSAAYHPEGAPNPKPPSAGLWAFRRPEMPRSAHPFSTSPFEQTGFPSLLDQFPTPAAREAMGSIDPIALQNKLIEIGVSPETARVGAAQLNRYAHEWPLAQWKPLPWELAVASTDPRPLGRLTPDEFAALSLEQLRRLSAEQMGVLRRQQLEALSDEQWAALSGEQVAALDLQVLGRLSPEIFAKLSTDQLSHLTIEQMGALRRWQLEALSDEQLAAFSAEQKGALHPRVMENLPPELRSKLFETGAPDVGRRVVTVAAPYAAVAAIGTLVNALPSPYFERVNAIAYGVRAASFALKAVTPQKVWKKPAEEGRVSEFTPLGRILEGVDFTTFSINFGGGYTYIAEAPAVWLPFEAGTLAFGAQAGRQAVTGKPAYPHTSDVGLLLFVAGSGPYIWASTQVGAVLGITAGTAFLVGSAGLWFKTVWSYGSLRNWKQAIRMHSKYSFEYLRGGNPKPLQGIVKTRRSLGISRRSPFIGVEYQQDGFSVDERVLLLLGSAAGLGLFSWIAWQVSQATADEEDDTSSSDDESELPPLPPFEPTEPPPEPPVEPDEPERPEPVVVGVWRSGVSPRDNSTLWHIARNNLDTLLTTAEKARAEDESMSADARVATFALPNLIALNPQHPLAENPDLIQPGWELKVQVEEDE